MGGLGGGQGSGCTFRLTPGGQCPGFRVSCPCRHVPSRHTARVERTAATGCQSCWSEALGSSKSVKGKLSVWPCTRFHKEAPQIRGAQPSRACRRRLRNGCPFFTHAPQPRQQTRGAVLSRGGAGDRQKGPNETTRVPVLWQTSGMYRTATMRTPALACQTPQQVLSAPCPLCHQHRAARQLVRPRFIKSRERREVMQLAPRCMAARWRGWDSSTDLPLGLPGRWVRKHSLDLSRRHKIWAVAKVLKGQQKQTF